MFDETISDYILKNGSERSKQLLQTHLQSEKSVLLGIKEDISQEIGAYIMRCDYDTMEEMLDISKIIDDILEDIGKQLAGSPSIEIEQPQTINYTSVYPSNQADVCPICKQQCIPNPTRYKIFNHDKTYLRSENETTYFCRSCKRRFIPAPALESIDINFGIENTNFKVEILPEETLPRPIPLRQPIESTLEKCAYHYCNEPVASGGYCEHHRNHEGYSSN